MYSVDAIGSSVHQTKPYFPALSVYPLREKHYAASSSLSLLACQTLDFVQNSLEEHSEIRRTFSEIEALTTFANKESNRTKGGIWRDASLMSYWVKPILHRLCDKSSFFELSHDNCEVVRMCHQAATLYLAAFRRSLGNFPVYTAYQISTLKRLVVSDGTSRLWLLKVWSLLLCALESHASSERDYFVDQLIVMQAHRKWRSWEEFCTGTYSLIWCNDLFEANAKEIFARIMARSVLTAEELKCH